MEQLKAPFEELTPSVGEFTPLNESPSALESEGGGGVRSSQGMDADLLGLFGGPSSVGGGRAIRPSPPPDDWTGMLPFGSPSASPRPMRHGSSPLTSIPFHPAKAEGEWQTGQYDDEDEENIFAGTSERDYHRSFLDEDERRAAAGSGAAMEENDDVTRNRQPYSSPSGVTRGDYSSGGGYFGPRSAVLESSAYERYLTEKARGLKKQQDVIPYAYAGPEDSEEAIMARLRERVQGISFSPSTSGRWGERGDGEEGSPSGESEAGSGTQGKDISCGFGSSDTGKVEGNANELSPRRATETTVLIVRSSIDSGGYSGPAYSESEGNAMKDSSVPLLGTAAPHKPRAVDQRTLVKVTHHHGQPSQHPHPHPHHGHRDRHRHEHDEEHRQAAGFSGGDVMGRSE